MLFSRTRKPTPVRKVTRYQNGYRIPGGGYASLVKPAQEFRGTTRQACGLWPFGAGSGAPIAGIPQGPDLSSGSSAGLDIIRLFKRKMIANPSCGISSLPGLGKSALVKHSLAGHDAFGDIIRTLADIKGEYTKVIRAMGGTVVEVGPGRGIINPLDPGNALEAAGQIRAEAARIRALEDYSASMELQEKAGVLEDIAMSLIQDLHSRQSALVSGLITISRREPLTDREESVLDAGIRLVRTRMGEEQIPELKDLLDVIVEGPQELHDAAISRGDEKRYQDLTEDLEASLRSLVFGGPLGTIFSGQTSERPRVDQHASWSLASIGDERPLMQAGAMLAVWSQGFGDVNVAHALADAGLATNLNFALVMDEFWRPMALGMGLVAKANSLTRLNRHEGVGMYYIFHTFKDFEAIRDPQDLKMAKEFLTRCGLLIIGGQRAREIGEINAVAQLTDQEAAQIITWGDAPKLSANAADLDLDEASAATLLSAAEEQKHSLARRRSLPGEGKFLFKVGSQPGLAIDIKLTPTELRRRITESNERWEMTA